MKQVFAGRGKAFFEKVPAPITADNEVLVRVSYSCISAGTESSSVRASGKSPIQKLIEKPKNVKKLLEMIKKQGIGNTVLKIKGRLNAGSPIGYSASGTVIEAGKGIVDIKAHDRVACAGTGIANHAEFISVPRNLLVKIPDNLGMEQAATVALGSIALQGVRRAGCGIGEIAVVIGLGILGQLTVQMLRAAGCRVIGIDTDRRRGDIAVSCGLSRSIDPGKADSVQEVGSFSGGRGADAVIITAASASSGIINQAMEMCRRKGRVIIVGAVGMDLKREHFYKKELDVLISTSYGPGRYDEKYEKDGIDYPYGYVRWTENRNMADYLRMLCEKTLDIAPLIEKIYPVEDAGRAFNDLSGAGRPLITLLRYEGDPAPDRKIVVSARKAGRDVLNVALVGAGGFAKSMHIPNLERLSGMYNIRAVVDKAGGNAMMTAKLCRASYATTDFDEVMKDKDVDAVFITTRHNLHAKMAMAAARAGKAVFTEKPMSLSSDELEELTGILEEKKTPFTVGFNRRFSPFAARIKSIVKDRINPMIVNYRMNAGFIPAEHWVHSQEGGGRNIGEACHIYDLFNFLTEAEASSVTASSITPRNDKFRRNDNFIATVKYADGSVCSLIYTALGSRDVSKERMDVYSDGRILSLDDYKTLTVFGSGEKGLETAVQDKGHFEELKRFGAAVKEGDGYPIPLWQLVQATMISFKVEQELSDGR
ncbi:MAG: bi-domain-containing oxidoreductase [Elusimicrobia bacterium]|nr:bi-domain-containing oxidoreductase [Elusimicrobiota bacterium]